MNTVHSARLTALLFLCFGFVAGQTPATSATLTVSQVLDAWVTNVEKEVMPAAAALGENNFHLLPARERFRACGRSAGKSSIWPPRTTRSGRRSLVKNPRATSTVRKRAPNTVRSKAEILEYLKASFAYLHHANRRNHRRHTRATHPRR